MIYNSLNKTEYFSSISLMMVWRKHWVHKAFLYFPVLYLIIGIFFNIYIYIYNIPLIFKPSFVWFIALILSNLYFCKFLFNFLKRFCISYRSFSQLKVSPNRMKIIKINLWSSDLYLHLYLQSLAQKKSTKITLKKPLQKVYAKFG